MDLDLELGLEFGYFYNQRMIYSLYLLSSLLAYGCDHEEVCVTCNQVYSFAKMMLQCLK